MAPATAAINPPHAKQETGDDTDADRYRDPAQRQAAAILFFDALESFVRISLGERFHELEIDPEAIAAASLAQVHLAKIRATGEWICIKVQYPGLAEVIDSDFDAVVRMLVIARWVKSAAKDCLFEK